MNSVTRSKVPGNGSHFHIHSPNRLSVEDIDDNIIKPERAVQILKDDGMIVTIEQANTILEFLYKLADIALSQHFPK